VGQKSFLHSKSSLLRRRPLTVGTLVAGFPLHSQWKAASHSSVDVVEVRLDGFSASYRPVEKAARFALDLLKRTKKETGKPVLLTLRAPDERETKKSIAKPISDQTRLKILSPLLPLVQLVDVEIRHQKFAQEMTRLAHRSHVDVIHSLHDFSPGFRLNFLQKWSEVSRRLKGDVFKVAITPENNDQLEAFLTWGSRLSNPKRILIGMGAVGLISRLVGFSFRSLLTYGHLGTSAAPGQIAARKVGQVLPSLYGNHLK